MKIQLMMSQEAIRRAWIERGVILDETVTIEVPTTLSAEDRRELWDLMDALNFRNVPQLRGMTKFLPGFRATEVPVNMEGWRCFIGQLRELAQETGQDVVPARLTWWQRIKEIFRGGGAH